MGMFSRRSRRRVGTVDAELTTGGRLRGQLHHFSALEMPNFRMLWFGMLLSMGAMQMNIIDRSWLAYHISGSGLALGLVALGRGLPQLLLAPVGGAAADRFDKRKLLISSQFCLMTLALANAILVQLGVIQIWHLIVIGVFQGIIFPFAMPTRTAYIGDLVDEERFPNALALDSTGRNLNRVIAPSIGGILIAFSPTLAFYMIAVFYLLSALMLMRLPSPKPAVRRARSMAGDMAAGIRYLTARNSLLLLIGMAFVMVLLGGPYQQLLPVFQIDVLHVGPTALGLMYTAVGLGAVFGSLAAVFASESPNKRKIQLGAGISVGLSLTAFAFSNSIYAALFFLVIVGFMTDGYFTINRILVMLETDREYYGRVVSIYMMTWSLMPLALVPMGELVDHIGAPVTVGVAAIMLALIIGGITLFSPHIRRREEPEIVPAFSD
jgi:MFS family permease